jgi:hypothetical protein
LASWKEVLEAEPAFAAEVVSLFDASKHKTIATLRKDGGPRISGIEATFTDGDLWIGSMKGSLKSADLLRDPRLALHSASIAPPDDPSAWAGDAKLSGRAVLVDDPERLRSMASGEGADELEGDLFRVDIDEVVVTRIGDPADHLLIRLWRPGSGLRETKRY